MPVPLSDILSFKLIFGNCWKWVDDHRSKNKLPELDYHGHFFPNEYVDRFPMIIPTSPSIYGHPHPSSEYVFIGGLRNESNFQKVDKQMEIWINASELDIVYISLGTHALVDAKILMNLYEKISSQNDYRVIWSLSIGLQKVATDLNIFSKTNEKIIFRDYLPQYTILGNPKVKVYVTHCGLGSLVDLIKRKIPSIFVPQFGDQFTMAIILDKLQLGVYEQKFTFETINSAIAKLFENYEFYCKNLKKIEQEFAQYENEEDIHSFVSKVANRKKVTMKTRLEYQVNSPRVHLIWKICVISSLALVLTLFLAVVFCLKNLVMSKKTSHKKKE